MKKVYLILLSVILLGSSCQQQTAKSSMKAPTRVKTLVVSSDVVDNAQTYVGMVEEREADASQHQHRRRACGIERNQQTVD